VRVSLGPKENVISFPEWLKRLEERNLPANGTYRVTELVSPNPYGMLCFRDSRVNATVLYRLTADQWAQIQNNLGRTFGPTPTSLSVEVSNDDVAITNQGDQGLMVPVQYGLKIYY